ncbi:hypothetical protein [Gordonia rhizosphera]|uniref:Uncharacterized protein n=1 Tax=Gordonia rhizosphera NBRC 16068 TaxID=1108045 RepID=K6X2X9_9ACTN|nr:hypothetical protein [Gordonia rhizosphera]GAB93159.1 hypothetical protein GORHZ_207_00080 [Gordonia rhizosphera NBRC 16068]
MRTIGRPTTTADRVEDALAGGGFFTYEALVHRVWPIPETRPSTAKEVVRNIVSKMKARNEVETATLNRRTIVRLVDAPAPQQHNSPEPPQDDDESFDFEFDSDDDDFEFD